MKVSAGVFYAGEYKEKLPTVAVRSETTNMYKPKCYRSVVTLKEYVRIYLPQLGNG